ncbi:Hypothetical_protein [Hexamita inflata]|uniref:Hypothetical_protein n=1 Tax=Hexamita inflata TaxID=28002 RepID=A0AA86PPR1_9EUKA|nr:Hypothetical protein HINF_LOCUS31730 [Hexamita inflata]
MNETSIKYEQLINQTEFTPELCQQLQQALKQTMNMNQSKQDDLNLSQLNDNQMVESVIQQNYDHTVQSLKDKDNTIKQLENHLKLSDSQHLNIQIEYQQLLEHINSLLDEDNLAGSQIDKIKFIKQKMQLQKTTIEQQTQVIAHLQTKLKKYLARNIELEIKMETQQQFYNSLSDVQ